jgi:hypothetical protein
MLKENKCIILEQNLMMLKNLHNKYRRMRGEDYEGKKKDYQD